MMYNLLQTKLDFFSEMFINGFIDYNEFERIELRINEVKHLYIICLN